MRVLIVQPPRKYWPFTSEGDNFLLQQALPALAAPLRDAGMDVHVIDCMPLHIGWKSLADEIKRLDSARKYGMGLRYAGQWSLAEFDMQLVGGKPRPALEVWKEIAGKMPLGFVEGTMFPASFGHLMGGYAAGYYFYLWAEVLDADGFEAFEEAGNPFHPDLAARLKTIFEAGDTTDPMALYTAFRGRRPQVEALLRKRGLVGA
jgi:Zn-dependent oligopeptidase